MDLPRVFREKMINAGREAAFKYGKRKTTGFVINKNNLKDAHLAAIKYPPETGNYRNGTGHWSLGVECFFDQKV